MPTTALSSSASASSFASSAAATNAIQAAINKTRAATVFHASEQMTFDQAFGSTRDGNTLIRLDGDFNASDFRIQVGGGMIAMLGMDPAGSLEMIKAGGKTYAHGPAAGIGAPDNKWYVIDPSQGITGAPNAFDTYDMLMKQKLDFAAMKLARTTTDALACDVYQSSKEVAANLWSSVLFSATGVAPVVDDGTMEISVCKDGYLHDWTINLTGHDSKNTSVKGTALFRYNFSNFDTKVAIVAPTDAVPSVAPTGGLFGLLNEGKATPTVPVSDNGRSSSSASANPSATVNGEWKGATDLDGSVSFTIENNQLTFASLNLVSRSDNCSGSTSIGKSISNTPVVNNSFNAIITTSDGAQITFGGTFSAGQFKGAIGASGKLPCNATSIQNTWTAHNTSAVAPTPTKSVASSSSSSSRASSVSSASSAAGSDPISLTNAFFTAINAKNYTAAVVLVDDNVIYTFGSSSNSMGKDSMRGFLGTQNVTYTVSNFQAIGSIVKFAVTTSDGKSYPSSQAIWSNGLIQILTIK